VLFGFSEYPLEKVILTLSSFNPIDLGRIYLMLQMDVSALMGYTGATYKEFFGSSAGLLYTLGILVAWMLVPLWLSIRSFSKKDL
jgi:Cu-processing system permease protein